MVQHSFVRNNFLLKHTIYVEYYIYTQYVKLFHNLFFKYQITDKVEILKIRIILIGIYSDSKRHLLGLDK